MIAHVGAEIEFGETARAGDAWNSADFDPVHPKRDNADPGRAFEGVKVQAIRKQCGYLGRLGTIMRKEEVVPPLSHGPSAGRQRPRALRCPEADLPHRLSATPKLYDV